MITTRTVSAPLRVTFVGHIDHGKSTLIGRLLHDAEALSTSDRDELARLSRREGSDGIDFAFALDRLTEERSKGITIDTTRRPLVTDRREYEIIDAPGHPEFLKNMLSGATSADTAVLLIDADQGVRDQTRRHAMLLRLVGIDRVLLAVNKLDLCGFDEGRFRKVAGEAQELLASVGVDPVATVPLCARDGDNVVHRSERSPWYCGPTLLDALHDMDVAEPRAHAMRFPVQDVIRVNDRPVLLGRVESGRIEAGEPVLVLPANRTLGILEVLPLGDRSAEASAGDCPGLRLEDSLVVGRGDVVCDPAAPPPVATRARVTLFWMRGGIEVPTGDFAGLARIGTRRVPVRILAINRRFDSATLRESADRSRLDETDVAEVVLEFAEPVVLERHADFPPLGRLTIETDRDVLAAGIVRGDLE